jgi:hypothetical protein
LTIGEVGGFGESRRRVVRSATGRMDDTSSAVGDGCYGRRRVVWLAAGAGGVVGDVWYGQRLLARTTTSGANKLPRREIGGGQRTK